MLLLFDGRIVLEGVLIYETASRLAAAESEKAAATLVDISSLAVTRTFAIRSFLLSLQFGSSTCAARDLPRGTQELPFTADGTLALKAGGPTEQIRAAQLEEHKAQFHLR